MYPGLNPIIQLRLIFFEMTGRIFIEEERAILVILKNRRRVEVAHRLFDAVFDGEGFSLFGYGANDMS